MGLQKLYQEDDEGIHQLGYCLGVCPTNICEDGLERLKGEVPAFRNMDQFLEYFQDNWIEGNYPLRMNMYSLDGPRTNNNAEGWHSKICKLAGKAHPNIYKAVELFKAEQTATEVSLMQLAVGGLPIWRRRKYRSMVNSIKRLLTIKKKCEAGDYTLSELVKAFSNWVSFYPLTTLVYSHWPKIKIKNF